MIDVLPWALAAYLLGSVPTAYLAGRLTKGIDIREYGSGNVGGANALATIGARAGILVAVIDVAKGALIVGLARLLGNSEAAAAVAALAVTAGHNWSLFLGFTGGRGVGTVLGAAIFLDPVAAAFAAGPGLILMGFAKVAGWRIIAQITLAAALALPIVAWLVGSPPLVMFSYTALVGLLIAKRLLGNRGRRTPVSKGEPPVGEPLHRLLVYRLLFDRDTASYEEWVGRRPSESASQDGMSTHLAGGADPLEAPR